MHPSVGFNIDLDGASNLYVTNYLNGYQINWLSNGQIIQGLNTNIISPTVSGDYQAMLSTLSGCKYFSNIYSYSLLVEESNYDFKCFPNPSNEQLILSWEGQEIQSLEIYNYNGQLIDQLDLNYSPPIQLILLTMPMGFIYLK